MRGLDYRWIEALDAVVNLRSFDKAAQQLSISQSAVSQRIKQLEKWVSQPVLVREQPPRATHAGQKLLGLYRRVSLIEQDFMPELESQEQPKPLAVAIATNADTLATWLIPSLQPVINQYPIALDLIVDDEGRTLEKLRSGEVIGAISVEPHPIPGCVAHYLASIDYLCVASPRFYKRYFNQGVTRDSLLNAPAAVFNQHDQMHERYIKHHFNLSINQVTKHTVRSSEAFVALAEADGAYCLIPRPQITHQLEAGYLIEMMPGKHITQPLYWHHWAMESRTLQAVSHAIIDYAQQNLPQAL